VIVATILLVFFLSFIPLDVISLTHLVYCPDNLQSGLTRDGNADLHRSFQEVALHSCPIVGEKRPFIFRILIGAFRRIYCLIKLNCPEVCIPPKKCNTKTGSGCSEGFTCTFNPDIICPEGLNCVGMCVSARNDIAEDHHASCPDGSSCALNRN
jgi:hypothetical protein